MDGSRYKLFAVLLVSTIASLFSTSAWARPPSVAEVRQRALQYAGLDGPIDHWSARARWRNLLPKVTAGLQETTQLDDTTRFYEYMSRDANDALLFDAARNENGHNSRDRFRYEVRATIDFRGLVFDRAELQAERLARARSNDRRELVTMVHDAYFRRLALLDELGHVPPDKRAGIRLQVVQTEATLDGLTGGWFSRRTYGGKP